MAEPTTTTLGVSAEDLDAINKGLASGIEKLEKWTESALKSTKAGEMLNNILKETGISKEKLLAVVEKVSARMKQLDDFGNSVSNVFKELRQGTIDTTNGMQGLSTGLTVGIGLLIPLNKGLDEAIGGLDKFGTSGIKVGKEIEGMTDKMKEFAGKIPGAAAALKIMETIKPFADRADQAKQMENAFLGISAAAGDLGGELRSTLGVGFEDLDAKMMQFNVMAANVASATGVSTNEAMKYAMELKQVPGALEQMVPAAGSATGQLSMLDAVIRVSRGTHQDASKVIATLSDMYKILGTSGENAISIISRMYEVGNRIKMPAEMMKGYVTDAAKAFRFLGDNTQGAMDIMSKMGGALRDSGMGPAAVQEIVGGYLQGISELSVAQKAFMSSQSGGPGGLRGGFEMDLMLKNKDFSGMAAKVETAMRGMFGGRIVKLEEASKSEGAASQMLKQVELVKSFGLAKSDTQAYRVLESLEGRGTAGPGKGEVLQKAIEEGNSMADRQTPIFNNMLNQLTLANNIATIHTGLLMKDMGVQGPIERAVVEKTALDIGTTFNKSKGIDAMEAYAGSGKSAADDAVVIADKIGSKISTFTDDALGKLSGFGGEKETEKAANVPLPEAAQRTQRKGAAIPEQDFLSTVRGGSFSADGEFLPGGLTTPPRPAPEVRETITVAEQRKIETGKASAERGGREYSGGKGGANHLYITAQFGTKQDITLITNEFGEIVDKKIESQNGKALTGIPGTTGQ